MSGVRTRKWTDKAGVERYTTEIVGHQLTLVGGAGAAKSSNTASPASEQAPNDDVPPPDDLDDIIPF